MRPSDMAHVINGERFLTIKDFAVATKRSEQNVRYLIWRGNRIRRLRIVRVAGKPLVPFSELTEFPFTPSGRNTGEIYHYGDEDASPAREEIKR